MFVLFRFEEGRDESFGLCVEIFWIDLQFYYVKAFES